MARGGYIRKRRFYRRRWYGRRDYPAPSRDVAWGSTCFDLQGGTPGRNSMLAERFGLPTNCPVKIYAAVVNIAADANCLPGVVRVQFGGGVDKGDVAISRVTCITAGVVKRFFLRASSTSDFHMYLPNTPVVTMLYGSDCGRGSLPSLPSLPITTITTTEPGKLQVSATVYYLRQGEVLG